MTTLSAAWQQLSVEERQDIIKKGRQAGTPYKILASRHSTTMNIIAVFARKVDRDERNIERRARISRPELSLVPPSHGRPLADLGDGDCHWPLWENGGANVYSQMLFCAAGAEPDHKYCAKHHAEAHTAPAAVPKRYRMNNLQPGRAA